jgi:hypothetical protein
VTQSIFFTCRSLEFLAQVVKLLIVARNAKGFDARAEIANASGVRKGELQVVRQHMRQHAEAPQRLCRLQLCPKGAKFALAHGKNFRHLNARRQFLQSAVAIS